MPASITPWKSSGFSIPPAHGRKVVMRDGKEPQSIAILHCIGSRDKNHYEYCSRVCCMYS